MAEDRRDTKGFEPPPWERAAFEELRRKREAAAADRDLSEAVDALRTGTEEPAERQAPPSGPEPEVSAPAPMRAEPPAESLAEEPAAPEKPALEEHRVTAMLAELAALEPQPMRELWMVEVGAGVFLALLGLSVLVWGLVGGARAVSSPEAAPFALVMIVFGASFIALGLWLGRRGLRNRGVG
ncbi:MAG: hypothetical protein C0418_00130 [Coriobacteriaceae bacterium]|nr:hypothetical protein [Coriobacteriaceae bacterium]